MARPSVEVMGVEDESYVNIRSVTFGLHEVGEHMESGKIDPSIE